MPTLELSELDGLCACGCGLPAPLAKQSRQARGFRKGEPQKYILGHVPAPERTDPATRFWPKVRPEPGLGSCWIWTGARSPGGYGIFAPHGTRTQQAHRFAYTQHCGPIPAGLQIDHLCRNRACVNPSHLEAVTQRENIQRGVGVSVLNAAKTHCPSGHPYSPENTRISPKGQRLCKECDRLSSHLRYHRRRNG